MVESRQADESETYLYDNDNDRADLFYSAGTLYSMHYTAKSFLFTLYCIAVVKGPVQSWY